MVACRLRLCAAMETQRRETIMKVGTITARTRNCEIMLTGAGFYARCTAPNCTWVSEYTASKSTARRWANDHDEERLNQND